MDRAARSCRAHPARPTLLETPPLGAVFAFGLLPTVPPWELVVRAVLVYVALMVTLRIFGKREVGQFTLYDLVFILLVANALQPAITGPDSSLVGGLVLIVALVLTNFIVGRLDSIPRLHRLFAAPPAVVVRDGKFQRHAMQREGVMPGEIEMAAREHGLKDVKEVELATLEEDGTISIVGTGATQHGRRRGRFRQRPGN